MQGPVQEFLLRQTLDELRSFSEGAFRVGLVLGEPSPGGACGCCPRSAAPDPEASCTSFWDSLRDDGEPSRRCPEGLTVIGGRVDLAPGRQYVIATQGFLRNGESSDVGRTGKVPRLSEEQSRLLEGCVAMSASLLRTIARSAREAAHESLREQGWLDLAGAPSLLGVSAGIRTLRDAVPSVANSAEPLLIEGEPGSGRGLLAVTVHRLGPRRDGPFVRESLPTLPEAMQETELFGDGNGSRGLFAEAAGGTLYLAGVDRLLPSVQKRLLARLGPGRDGVADADVRLVVSVAGVKGRGRGLLPALGERLGALRLLMPPLRERLEDIPLLVEHLLARRAAALGIPPVTVSPEALDALKRHPWAGNVRELDEELARAAAGRTAIRLEDLPPAVARSARTAGAAPAADLRKAVGELEREMIENALGETGWNKSRAAAQLGLSRLGLQKKIDRYGIDRRRPGARPAGGSATK